MKKSQNNRILKYLKRGYSITPLYALKRFGCFRLASRISDLKKDGVKIRREMVNDKYTGKHYAKYFLANSKT